MSVQNVLSDVIAYWKSTGIPRDLIPRETNIPLDTEDIVVITGVRRSGKTYMLFQLMKELMNRGVDENKIFYINFEDERIFPKTEYLTELIPTIIRDYRVKQPYLFLDEIHRIPNWDLWLHRQHARNMKLYVTGSTIELQPDKIPKALRGRTLTYTIYPLSFGEFLRFKNVRIRNKHLSEDDRALIKRYLNEYIRFGGFPEIVKLKENDLKLLKLHEYFRAIMYRDIMEAHAIRNISLLEATIKLLLNSTFFGTRRFRSTLKSIGFKASTKTIFEYKKAIESAYLIQQIEIFSYKTRDRLQYPKKIYCIDHGLRSALSLSYSKSIGRILENAVYVELLRLKKPIEEISYWKSRGGYEVDFVITKMLKPMKIIQVAYELEDNVRRREERSLLKAMKEFKLNKGIIIANTDYQQISKINNKEIIYLPLLDFFLKPQIIEKLTDKKNLNRDER